MKTKLETVCFKSVSPFFEKERNGLKPNTVRVIDLDDERFLTLEQWAFNNKPLGEIQIMNPNTGAGFRRKVKDVSFWNRFCIISWEHEE